MFLERTTGSWNSGIAAVKVDAESGKPANLGNPWGTDADIASYGKLIYTRQMGNRWQAMFSQLPMSSSSAMATCGTAP